MSERAVGALLVSLRRVATLQRLYGSGHPLTTAALDEAAASAAALSPSGPAQLTIVDDSVYLDRTLLPVASLAHNGFLRVMRERGVVSLTLVPPVQSHDLARLTAVLAGESRDFPETGSVRLNQGNLSPEDLAGAEGHGGAYTATLDLLRAVSFAIIERDRASLSEAALAVRTLMDLCVEDPAAALLLSTMKSHSEYTFYHSVNTCILTLMIGRAAGLDTRDQVLLGMGALLHDIGKIGVPESVLQHPGRLSPEQWAEIRRHPHEGAEAILTASEPGQEVVAVVALEHHARYDGSGYPNLFYFEEPPDHTGPPRRPAPSPAPVHPLHRGGRRLRRHHQPPLLSPPGDAGPGAAGAARRGGHDVRPGCGLRLHRHHGRVPARVPAAPAGRRDGAGEPARNRPHRARPGPAGGRRLGAPAGRPRAAGFPAGRGGRPPDPRPGGDLPRRLPGVRRGRGRHLSRPPGSAGPADRPT